MPDQIARKHLKKRMLDRWENEGGRIAADPISANEGTPVSGHEGGGRQLLASRDESKVVAPASLTKRSKPTQK